MAVETIGAPAMTVVVRAMEPRDLPFAAALHERSLRHGLFPELGQRFLVRYLETYIHSPASVALIAEWAGAPAGFLVGVLHEPSHYRKVLRRRGARLAGAGFAALVRRPRVFRWFCRTRARRYALGLRRLVLSAPVAPPVSANERPAAVLNHVAVLPELRSAGIGARLVGTFTDAARDAGVEAARLTTRAGSEGAGDFYRRLGWRRTGAFVDADGLSWERFRFDDI